MYVRDAKNREEVWLLDNIEAMGLDETAFRSRDYVVVVDETSGEKAGFGRIRIHKPDDAPEICELTSIGVVESWRGQGVGAHVIERLIDKASDDDFEEVYSLVGVPDYLAQFGFEPLDVGDLPSKLRDRLDSKRDDIEPDAIPMVLAVDSFEMPDRLRERFKDARPHEGEPSSDEDAEEMAEEFGIDPDDATYKYDTGRH
ncbi:GNAT family N-acetyltransferase [Haladaptatus sp. W1]|uniref:GNAT family N-acetyltransferase n=1 Tax=Haladaptatus sp. W1 TaxID=1897478 RepID=UPI000849DBA0|nr:GNAT family N-acetyltransferase [Haladaptatus sp. W1]ODR83033.1 GNAT family N-acetyltransferase [Haladaptatus sp. W1]